MSGIRQGITPSFVCTVTSTNTYDRSERDSTPETSASNSMSTTQNSTIDVGGDSLISGSATLSQPIFP